MRDANGYQLCTVKIARINKPGRYGDGGGLYLRIAEYPRQDGTPARSRNWVFRFERDGRERWMGLGALSTLSLAQARALARECRALLVQGLDPIDARQARRRGTKLAAARATTFKQVALAYIKDHSPTWKNPAHRAQWPSTLATYVYPHIGDLAVDDIDEALVLKCLRPIWRDVPETASRVRGRIERVLDAAKAQGLRKGLENPARWRGHLENLLPSRKSLQPTVNRPAMPDVAMPAFMAELRGRGGIAARTLEFTVLTAARTGEALGAQWSEIDLEAKTWTVPKERMKAGKPHTVPLSDRAVAILKSADRIAGCDYVFPGAKDGMPLSNMAMLKLLRDMGQGVTVHGFRSTFSDWARDHTHHHRDVVEAALAHQIADKSEAAYRRRTAIEKRRILMAEWARYLAKPAVTAGGKVIAIGR